MKTVAEAELSEEYVANIVRGAASVLEHIGSPHLGPHPVMPGAYGSPGPTRETLLTWKWNEKTQRPSVHIRIVEMPAPDIGKMRDAEDDRQVKIAMRVAKGFKKI